MNGRFIKMLALLAFSLFARESLSQSGLHFRSFQSGDWHDPASWQTSPDLISWQQSSHCPDQDAASILIRSGHTITIRSNASAKSLIVAPDATLDNMITNGGYELRIFGGGTNVTAFDVFGTYVLYGRLPKFEGSASATIHPGGVVRVDGNSDEAAKESERFPQLTNVNFGGNAIFDWNTSDSFQMNGARFFPNASEYTVAVFRISKPVKTRTGSDTCFLNGLLEINAPVIIMGTGKKYFRNGITGSGTLTQGGESVGHFHISPGDGSGILGGSDLKIELGRPMYLVGKVSVTRNARVTISGANIRTDSLGSPFFIHGIFDITDRNVTNRNGTVVVDETGIFRTAHAGGFTGTGSTIPGGNVQLNQGSTIELYSHSDQVLKTRSDFSNLIFSGSGTKSASDALSYNGTMLIRDDAIFDATRRNVGAPGANLTMTGGRLILGTIGTQPSMDGNIILTGGIIEFANKNASEQTIRTGTYHHIEVTGSNVKNSSGKIQIRPNGSFIIKNGAVYSSNSGNAAITAYKNVPASQTLIVESGGLFRTGVEAGFYGPAPNQSHKSPSVQESIPTVILQRGSTVAYTGGNQSISSHAGVYNYQNLTLSGAGIKTAPAGQLTIKGDLVISPDATFIHNNGTLTFHGGEDEDPTEMNQDTQRLDANGAIFYVLENKSHSVLSVRSDLSVEKEFRLGEKTVTHLLTGDITIMSNASGTARVAPVPHNASILYTENGGRFQIERYVPRHTKAWQLLSVPASGGTIRESWQNNKGPDLLKGVNITGPFSDWKERGFDKYSPAPSMKWYNPNTNLFVGVENMSDMISDHPAYFLFVRGNRTVLDAADSTTSEVTLLTRGKLYTPQHPAPVISVAPDQFALVGNPLASPISFEKITTTGNLEDGYYIWDPRLTRSNVSDYGLGAYRKIIYEGGELITIPDYDDPNYAAGKIPPIQSGQGFFVYHAPAKGDMAQATLTFTEDSKVEKDANIFRQASPATQPAAKMQTNLFVRHGNADILLDGALHLFHNDYAAAVDKNDGRKMMNGGENLFIAKGGHALIVERRPFPAEGDTIHFHITNLQKRFYSLAISTSNLETAGHDIFLHDQHLNLQRRLEHHKTWLPFTVDHDAGSARKDRFFLTFKKTLLPFSFRQVHSIVRDDHILLCWKAENQHQVAIYQVERSRTPGNFTVCGEFRPSDLEHGLYEFKDQEPEAGKHIFRIKATMKNGSTVYSPTAEADIQYRQATISLSPNPARDVLHLDFYRYPAGKYMVKLLRADGSAVLTRPIVHEGFRRQHRLPLRGLPPGIYYVRISSSQGVAFNSKVFIQ